MLKDHFRSRGFIEGGIIRNGDQESLDMSALPPFLRTLLVTDGTVTKSLEAFFWENVRVETLRQEDHQLTKVLPSIAVQAGDSVLKRDVLLRGDESNNVYAYATSYLITDMLDSEIRQNLLEGKIGIGELLREIGLETYREIVDFGSEMFHTNEQTSNSIEVIYRTYVIHIGGKPTIQITERFPLELFLGETT